MRYKRSVDANTIWEKAQRNEWCKWAEYTGQKNNDGKECIVCASEKPRTQVIDIPWGSEECRN